jgi:ATP phosphoribosyltransferase
MADVETVAHDHVARSGRRLRVATKYLNLTREFFAARGVADYRIVESMGATEGAPAAGLAELVVDITTTGATLEANGLRVLDDGLILRSQAQLAASLGAAWRRETLADARRLLSVIEARARARTLSALSWPADQDDAARRAAESFIDPGAWRANGALIAAERLFDLQTALAAAGVGPVTAVRPDYVFHADSPAIDELTQQLF